MIETWGTVETYLLNHAHNHLNCVGDGLVTREKITTMCYYQINHVKLDAHEPESEEGLYGYGPVGADYREKIYSKIMNKLCANKAIVEGAIHERTVRNVIERHNLSGLVGFETYLGDGGMFWKSFIYTSNETTLLILKLFFS